MTTFKNVLCLLAILVAYGIAGRLDYEDALRLEHIRQERRDADCLAVSSRQSVGRQYRSTKRRSIRPPATRMPNGRKPACLAYRTDGEATAMRDPAHITRGSASLLTVRTAADIACLVRENEVLTGQAGRTFVIASADWLAYRVHCHEAGLKVERLDVEGHVLSTQHLLPGQFVRNSLIEALAVGQLFTPPVGRIG